MIKLTLSRPVRPVVLKNSKQMVFARGKPRLIPQKGYGEIEHAAVMMLKSQWRGKLPIDYKVNAKVTFRGAWFEANHNYPDLDNLYGGPHDWLEKAGILRNDRLIESHDGSRRVYVCDACVHGNKEKLTRRRGCVGVRQCGSVGVDIEISAKHANN